jgi:pyoverdine/dityrosine biosynthesis protein Dit1
MIKKIKAENTFEIIKEAVKLALSEMDITTKDDLKYLPDKDTFFEENLKILKRLDNIEEQTKMLSNRTYDNTDRIEKLKNIHPNYAHPTLA